MLANLADVVLFLLKVLGNVYLNALDTDERNTAYRKHRTTDIRAFEQPPGPQLLADWRY